MTHRGAASSRCFHNSRDFCFELLGKNTAFQRGSAAEKPWTSFTGTLSFTARRCAKEQSVHVRGRRQVVMFRLSDWCRDYPIVRRGGDVDCCTTSRDGSQLLMQTILVPLGYFDRFWISCWSERDVLGVHVRKTVEKVKLQCQCCMSANCLIVRVHFLKKSLNVEKINLHWNSTNVLETFSWGLCL